MEELAHVVISHGQVRVEPERLFVASRRFLESTQARQYVAEVVVGLRQARPESNSLLAVSQGFRRDPKFQEQLPEIASGLGEGRVLRDGGAEMLECEFFLAQTPQGSSEA